MSSQKTMAKVSDVSLLGTQYLGVRIRGVGGVNHAIIPELSSLYRGDGSITEDRFDIFHNVTICSTLIHFLHGLLLQPTVQGYNSDFAEHPVAQMYAHFRLGTCKACATYNHPIQTFTLDSTSN